MPVTPVSANPKRFKAYIILIEVELIFIFLTSAYLAFQTQRLLPKLLMTLIWLGTIYLFYQTRLNMQRATDWEQLPFYDLLNQTTLLVYYLLSGFLTLTLITIVFLFTGSLYDFYFSSLIHNLFLIPILLFIILWSLETFILFPLIFYRKKPSLSIKKLISSFTAPFKKVSFWLIFACMLAVWGLIGLTGLGVNPSGNNIFDLGVPLLESQTLYIIALVAMGLWTGYTLSQWRMLNRVVAFLKRNNLIVFALIWLLTFIIWMAQPLPLHNNFILAPQPQFMNQIYPYSDAAVFDKSAVKLLIGESSGLIILRPLFTWFLSLCHRLVGFDYTGLVLCQTVVLALIPSLLFLIGKEIHHPLTGLFAAFAAILREVNAIHIANITVSSNSKLLLSDLPCMLAVLVLTFIMVKWLKRHQVSAWYAFWTGALIGLGTLVRTQVLYLLPVPLLLCLTLKLKPKQKLLQASLILLGLLLTITPMLLRNYQASGTVSLEDAGYIRHNVLHMDPSLQEAESDPPAANVMQNPGNVLSNTLQHFVRNLMSTFLIFPIRAGQITAWKTLFFINEPFWTDIYTVPNIANILQTLLQMCVFSLGLAVLFKRSFRDTLALLGVYMLYALSVSTGQFSGWRYILPVDWIGYLVYAVGLISILEIIFAFLKVDDPKPVLQNDGGLKTPGRVPVIILTAALIITGALVPLQERLTKPQLPPITTAQICTDMLNKKCQLQAWYAGNGFSDILQ